VFTNGQAQALVLFQSKSESHSIVRHGFFFGQSERNELTSDQSYKTLIEMQKMSKARAGERKNRKIRGKPVLAFFLPPAKTR
jgi:hypothetical protein